MSRTSIIAISATILIAAGAPALAQSAGGGSTVASPRPVNPSLGSTSGSNVGSSGASVGGVGGSSSIGSSSGTGISTSGPASAGSFSEGASDAAVATKGSSSVNSTNVDSIARGGNVGAAASSSGSGASGSAGDESISGSADTTTQNYGRAGSGTPAEYRIPEPKIGVDLQAIRGAMAADSSATPKANGD